MKDFDLYPSLTFQNDSESFANHLSDIVAHPRVSAFRLDFSESFSGTFIKSLTSLLRTHDVALILAPPEKPDFGTLPLIESDGIHFRDVAALKAGISALKSFRLQTGCFCQTLDEAMYAGEAGADYVSFPAEALDVIEKWSGFAELPCVAELPSSPASALEAVGKGAEFVSFSLNGEVSDLNWLRSLTSEEI